MDRQIAPGSFAVVKSRLNYLDEELVADNGSVVGAVAAIFFPARRAERRDGALGNRAFANARA
jgi:hypothetical protein